MAFQPVPNTWQMKLMGSLPNGGDWEANLYESYADYAQPTQVAADAFMGVIRDAYVNNNLDDQLNGAWSLDQLVVTGLDAETDAQFTSTLHPVNGTVAGEALPNTVAGLVNWNTALRGRSYRGRTFHPGFCEISSVGGGPTVTAKAALQAWADDVIDGLFSPDVRTMVVVSRFSGTELKSFPNGETRLVPIERPVALTTAVSAAAIDTWWKTQRRRGHGG